MNKCASLYTSLFLGPWNSELISSFFSLSSIKTYIIYDDGTVLMYFSKEREREMCCCVKLQQEINREGIRTIKILDSQREEMKSD